jgi:hypothetical protein
MVFRLTRSAAFEDQSVLTAFGLHNILQYYVIGSAYTRDGLATVVSASEQNKNITLIGDACMPSAPKDGDGWAPSILSFLSLPPLEFVLSERVFGAGHADIINLAERREARGS